MSGLRRALVACIALLAIAAGCSSSQAARDGGSTGGDDVRPDVPRLFSPDSFWNTPLADDAPIDPRSDVITASLRREVDDFGAWLNTSEFSTPIYMVGPDQPLVPVTVEHEDPAVREQATQVPIPPDAVPAAGTDRHLTVWQPSSDTLWELWMAERRDGHWYASAAGRVDGVSGSDGILPAPLGATATGLPAAGGTITLADLAAGEIRHVLAIAVVESRANWWSWPAQRTDGWVDSDTAVPEGARFRIDPDLDLDSLNLPGPTRMLAEAAQRYGIVVRDRSGAVSFYGEAPTDDAGQEAWDEWLGDVPVGDLMGAFPWEHLQLLEMELSTWNP